MRLLLEIFIISALLYLGWEKPFRDWLPSGMTGSNGGSAVAPPLRNATAPPAITPAVVRPAPYGQPTAQVLPQMQPQPSATPSGSWMFDPNHHSSLDPPHKTATPN